MLFKLIISLIIIICSSLIGMIYANAFIERTKLLGDLISTLQMLETEIVYTATPLPEMLTKIAQKSEGDIVKIFETTVNILEKKEGYLFSEAWKKAIKEEMRETTLQARDIALLISLGNNLGISDSADQVKHINLVREEIKRNYELSIILQKKNTRLYRNLGVLLGITIVIIFF